MPRVLVKVVSIFENNPQIDVVHGNTVLFYENGNEKIHEGDKNGLPYRYLAGLCFPQPSAFFRRSALEKVGYLNQDLHFGMDYDFFVRIALKGNFLKIDDTLTKYLLHDKSKSATSNLHFAEEWAQIFSKVLRSFDFTPPIIHDMMELGLYCAGNDSYEVELEFDLDFLQKSFVYFLGYQMIFRYQAYDLQSCRRIGRFLHSTDPEFLMETNLNPIFKRSAYPVPIIRFLRFVKGSSPFQNKL